MYYQISLESDGFNEELLAAPKTLRTLVERYKQKRISFDKQHDTLTNEDNNKPHRNFNL